MLRTKSLLAVISLTVLTAACAPRVSPQGFQVIDNKPEDIVVGTDTRESVLTKLGSPSTASTFEAENVWYYISQTTERYTYSTPKVTQRNITEITDIAAANQSEVDNTARASQSLHELSGELSTLTQRLSA